MKSFIRSFFASLLAVLVVILIFVGVVASKSGQKADIKDRSWLVVDLYGGISEYNPPVDIMSEIIGGKPETLHRILGNMDKVCVDDRIEGVLLKMSATNGAGRAMLEEIRGAVKKVQKSGKKVYGFSDAMDRHTYYLASACDSLFMPPTGYISFMGMSVTSEHIKDLLDKLGVNPNIHKIKDYKAAAEMILRTDMSEPVKENRKWMLDEYWDMYCGALEEDRGLTEENVIQAMSRAVFTIEEAVEFGLVDCARYWDDIENMLRKEGDDELRTVSQSRYAEVEPKKLGLTGKKKIAVIHAQGTIGGRNSKVDPLLGIMMGHESIVSELKRAQKDEDIVAVVFRVNSPGGESLASDLIGHQVEVTAGIKPVVVSMVDVAASGGYSISYRATKIIADPMTVTGSIGSISGKFNVKGLADKIGVTHDFLAKGPNALMNSPYKDYSKEQWELFRNNHWADFNMWLKDVADKREMTFEEAEKLAFGRIWTGRQGVENGLVDEVGGLDRAVEVAKELAGVPKDEKVSLVHYPVKRGILDEILGSGSFSAAANYVIYNYIRNDLAETWSFCTSRPISMIDDSVIR